MKELERVGRRRRERDIYLTCGINYPDKNIIAQNV
jgi:hypothetical protein